MEMQIVFLDGSSFYGKRGLKEIGIIPHETKGTHHFTVIDSDDSELIGKEVAVPISSVKYFVLNAKFDFRIVFSK